MRRASAIILVIAVIGCAPKYILHMSVPLSRAYHGDYGSALAALDSTGIAKSGKSRFLYHAERGHLLHLSGEYEASNVEFEHAVEIGKELEPTSVTATLSNYTLSETAKAYPGEDFERAYLHYYMALNYLMMDNYEHAMIEFRRLDEKFRSLFTRYSDGEQYQEDGFIRYLSGLAYEASRDNNDAFVDYRIATSSYTGAFGSQIGVAAPEGLIGSLVCLAKRLHQEDQVASYSRRHNSHCHQENAEVIIIVESGWAPYKRERSVTVPIHRELVPRDLRSSSMLAAIVKTAYPEFVSITPVFSSCSVRLRSAGTGGASVSVAAEKVMSIDKLAKWTLKRRINALKLRSIFRATVKQVALMKAKNEASEEIERLREQKSGGSSFQNVLLDKLIEAAEVGITKMVADTEVADTRSWVLLPSEIWMARIPVSHGRYDIEVRPGTVGSTTYRIGPVDVGSGTKVIRCCRVFGRKHPVRPMGSV